MAARTIIVTAYATADREPDTVSFGFGVQIRSKNAADDAAKRCELTAREIIAALVAQGIEERMISTTNVSTTITQERETERGPYVRYYDCSRDYSVKLPKAMFKYAESGIRTAVAKGANSVRNLEWSLSDAPSADLKLAALANAAEAARSKATLLASKLGAKLGAIRNIDDASYQRRRQSGSTGAGGDSNGDGGGRRGDYSERVLLAHGAGAEAMQSSMPESVVREGAHVTVEYDVVPEEAPKRTQDKVAFY